jgi:hypothetical protein
MLESVTLPFRSELIKVYPFANGGFWVHFLDGTKRMMDCEEELGWFFFNRQDQELADEIGGLISDYIDRTFR